MRSTAGLDGGDLARLLEVADVEDADAAEPLGAHRCLDALGAAVNPAARLLDGHEHQVAVDGQVALPARTRHRDAQLRLPRILDVVEVETVEVAEIEVRPFERQIGIREVQTEPAGRIAERFGLREMADELQVERGDARVVDPGLQADARIGWRFRRSRLLWRRGGRLLSLGDREERRDEHAPAQSEPHQAHCCGLCPSHD